MLPADYIFITQATEATKAENQTFGDLIFADNVKEKYPWTAVQMAASGNKFPTIDGDLLLHSIKHSGKSTKYLCQNILSILVILD